MTSVKTLPLLLFTICLSFAANADRTHVGTTYVTGAEAQELYESMSGSTINPGEGTTSRSWVKVDRAENQLKQTLCKKTFHNISGSTTYQCKIEKSLDGKPVPKYNGGGFPEPR